MLNRRSGYLIISDYLSFAIKPIVIKCSSYRVGQPTSVANHASLVALVTLTRLDMGGTKPAKLTVPVEWHIQESNKLVYGCFFILKRISCQLNLDIRYPRYRKRALVLLCRNLICVVGLIADFPIKHYTFQINVILKTTHKTWVDPRPL